ncbi:MAG: DUF1565 domain-containing protein [Candidatus Delongbacteria bacterium]|nr:DUF1565 domain-containing protein [Candidatus Delongbacteria bacterium]
MKNLIIEGNTSLMYGGGICSNNGSSPSLQNLTISGNTASIDGGGIYCSGNSSLISNNSIVWDNSPQAIYLETGGSTAVTYSDIQGGWKGAGNIDIDPLFVDPNNENFYLQSTSPCIDTGDPASPLDPDGTIADRGACYHCQYSSHVLHISTTGSNVSGDGSEEFPFSTIQYGISVSTDTDTVLVHPGTYVENINFIGKRITLGSLFLTTQDESYISSTIIDGNSTSRVVSFFYGENSSSILTGFTITNGAMEYGGGIYCNYTSPTLKNLIVTGNNAINGGGIYLLNASPNFENVTITGNTANNGGGIYSSQYSSNPIFTNSILWNNSPQDIYISSGSISVTYSDIQGGYEGIGNIDIDPLFVDPNNKNFHLQVTSPCIDAGDPTSPYDPDGTIMDMGACFYYQYFPFVLHISTTGSDVSGNGSEDFPFATIQHGINVSADTDTVLVHPGTYVENINFNGKLITLGSLFLTTSDTTYISSTIIDGNDSGRVVVFENNEDLTAILCGFTITNGLASGASWEAYGGGIYCNYSSPSLKNLRILGNYANHGGGIFCNNSSPSLKNLLIIDNSVLYSGGGIGCVYNSYPNIQNITISNNICGTNGGAISCAYDATPNLTNSILWNNASPEIYLEMNGSVTATYSDIQGGWSGTGNINNDPLFYDSANGNYHLQPISPCIDSGDPLSSLDPDSTRADIGAYYCPITFLNSPQNILIEIIGTDVNISWDEVINANSYIVYNSLDPYSNFSFQDFIADTCYTHQSVSQFSDKMFYQVSAYVGDLKSFKSFIATHPKFKPKELDAFIEKKKKR